MHARSTHPDPDQALRETLALARRSPFYAAHLDGFDAVSVDDLGRLPVTTKEHLRTQSPWGMIAVPREELWHYHESTGTTGEPIACWYHREELPRMGEAVARWFPDLTPGRIVLDRFPGFAPISFCMESALQILGGCHIPCGNLSWDVPFPRALDFVRTLRPQVIACLPLEMFLLRALADALGVDPARELDSLETAILAGAPLPPTMRTLVEREWNLGVREIYGSNETLFLGASCERGSLHLETSLYLAEVLDVDDHAPVAEGEPGILTITHVGPKAMPLVRYLTRDFVRVRPCECGRPEPAVDLLGREDEVAEYGGRRIFPNDVLDAGYRLADAHGSTIFFAVLRANDIVFRIEREDPRRPLDERTIEETAARLGAPVRAEAARCGDLLDPTALVRTPRVYKPTQMADWRRPGRRPLTIMEALLEWPRFDLPTSLSVVGRVWRTNRRRRHLLRDQPDQRGKTGDVPAIRSTIYR